jgi:hypothetical protein
MQGNEKCERRRLAARASFAVDECNCGSIHLTIGYVTIRLDPNAYSEMAVAIAEAFDRLSAHARPTIH